MSFETALDELVEEREDILREISRAEEALEELRDELADTALGIQKHRVSFNLTAEEYAKRVVAGVDFLNAEVPGWAKPAKIAVSSLDLADSQKCVLGQLAAKSALRSAGWDLAQARRTYNENMFGTRSGPFDYSEATTAFEEKFPEFSAEDHGFDWDCRAHQGEIADHDHTTAYEILNHLWNRAIQLRRAKKKVTVEKLVKAVAI